MMDRHVVTGLFLVGMGCAHAGGLPSASSPLIGTPQTEALPTVLRNLRSRGGVWTTGAEPADEYKALRSVEDQIKDWVSCEDLGFLATARGHTPEDSAALSWGLQSAAVSRLAELRCDNAHEVIFEILRHGRGEWTPGLVDRSLRALGRMPLPERYSHDLVAEILGFIDVASQEYLDNRDRGVYDRNPEEPGPDQYLGALLPAMRRHRSRLLDAAIRAGLDLELHPTTRSLLLSVLAPKDPPGSGP